MNNSINGFASRVRIVSLLRQKGVDESKLNILPKRAEFTEISNKIIKFRYLRYEYEYDYFVGAIRYKDATFGPWTKWAPFG